MTEKLTMPPSVERIIREVADHHKLGFVELMRMTNRTRRVAHVRFEAYYRIRNEMEIAGYPPSFSQIARWFGGVDHTSIMHGLNRFEEMHPSKVPPSCRGVRRIAYRAPPRPAPHRFQMLADLAEAAA